MKSSCGRSISHWAVTATMLVLLVVSPSMTMAQSPEPSQSMAQSPEPSQSPSEEPTKSPVTSPPTRETPDCFTSTTDLFEIMELASPFVYKVYTLCPNTVFDIGFNDDQGICCTGGDMTLYVKSKTHLKCGESGASTNNCTIRGGEFQLLHGPQIFEETIATEIKFEGITWEASTNTGLILANRGDLSFVDNIFKNQVNRAPIVIFYSPPFERRRLRELFKELPNTPRGRAEYYMRNPQAVEEWIQHSVADAEMAKEGEMVLDYEGRGASHNGAAVTRTGSNRNRALQPDFTLIIDFIDCQFYGNSQGRVVGLTQQGVVSVLSTYCPLTFVNCTFFNNTYTGVENRQDGYLVKMGGSPLEMKDTCMYNNNLTGFGSVQVYGNATIDHSNNFAYQNGYAQDFCQLIAQSDVDLPESIDDITCVEAERTECNGVAMKSSAESWSLSWSSLLLIPTILHAVFTMQ